MLKPMMAASQSSMVLPCEGHGQYSRYGQPVKAQQQKSSLRIVNALQQQDSGARTAPSHLSPWPSPSLTTLSNWSQVTSQGNTTALHAVATISQSIRTLRRTTAGTTPALLTALKSVMH
jgi:hypothetical protein